MCTLTSLYLHVQTGCWLPTGFDITLLPAQVSTDIYPSVPVHLYLESSLYLPAPVCIYLYFAVHAHLCLYQSVPACTCLYVHVLLFLYIHVHFCLYIYMYQSVPTVTNLYLHAPICTYKHIPVNTYLYQLSALPHGLMLHSCLLFGFWAWSHFPSSTEPPELRSIHDTARSW